MESLEQILIKVTKLNNNEKYDEVIKILTDPILQKYNNVNLYEEKAQAFWNIKNYIDSENSALKALEISKNSPKALNYLGNYNWHKKNYILSEKFFKMSIELNPKYSAPYNGLGLLFSIKNDLVNAEKNFKLAIECDKEKFSTLKNLANIYLKQNKYDLAKEYLDKLIEKNPNDAETYNSFGIYYNVKNEYNLSEESYKKAIKLNLESRYAYNNLAQLYYENEKYENSKIYFEKYINLNFDKDDFFHKRAISKIDEINNILDSKQFENINDTTSKIKNLLCFKNSCVSHYTGISVSKFLILNESPLRLSEGTFLNDTSEGKILFDYLDFDNLEQNNCIPNAFLFTKKPFIGSFVNKSKNNDLTLWRMYGKEALEEAKGCAITIDVNELKQGVKVKLNSDDEFDNLTNFEDLEFYNVAYLEDKKFTFSGASTLEKKNLNVLMIKLKNELENFKLKKNKKHEENLKIIELLNEIAYLFKIAEYQYENEVRLVIKEGIGFEKKIDENVNPPKVYIELIPIAPMIKEITIGPKVERADEWASAFHYHLQKKGLKPTINISNLPFK